MNISEIAIRRPVFAWMMMIALILFGAISFKRMGISQLPDVDFPVISVQISLEGAAPEVMETEIVDVIEDAVMTVQGIRAVSSYSRNGTATVSLEFELNRDIEAALQEVQTKIAQAQRNLPREMDPPVITKTNPEDQPILWISVTSESMPLKDLMSYVRDRLKDKFSTVPGVGDVFLGGYVEPNLRVWIDDRALSKYALTATDVVNAIQNEHSERPGGQIQTDTKQYNVRTLGEASSVSQFGDLVLNTRGGQPNFVPIRLRDVARIEDGLAEVSRISRTMGKPAVGVGIRKQRGSNAVAVGKAVKARMAEIRSVLPAGMEIGENFDSTRFIEESVSELNFTLLLSAILTGVVCWLFLGSFTATFNVLMAIPTSVVGAFIFLYFLGFTLNTFTLLGLTLAIGIVVDDAIMVLENIVRHREKGESRMRAALIGSREITFAALAATIAIVAIFLPVAFMKGVIGKFFFQFGVTMTVAVMLSLLEALTLTPMRCSQFVEPRKADTGVGRWLEALLQFLKLRYTVVLEHVLNHRWKVIFGSLVFFAVSFTAVKWLNKEFVPAQDQSIFIARLQTPVGSSITYTDSRFREAEKILADSPDVKRYFVSVGGFGGGGGTVNTGVVFVTLKPPKERSVDPKTGRRTTQQQLMNKFRVEFNKISDVKAFIQDLSMRGFAASRGFPVEFSVRGPDWEKLATYSQEIMKRLDASGLVSDVDTDYQLGMPEVQIIPDRVKAAARGVSIAAIGQTVGTLVGGLPVARYAKGGHRYDIRVQLPHERARVEDIGRIQVRNNRGELIPLSDVVSIQVRSSLQQIARFDRERSVSVFANVKAGASQADALAAADRISREALPEGYHAVMSGSAQTFKESFQGLIFALVLGLIVSYMVLASQFNSFLDPVTVLMALPFSLSGAFVALLIAGNSLNIYSMIGLILLMGIVKKNSILLVDFTHQARDRGVSDVRAALLEACPTRLRPILMTSVATIAAAIPPALAIGPGAETRIPMAVAVIGGVLVSTVLTLVVVPCVYSLLSRKGGRGEASL